MKTISFYQHVGKRIFDLLISLAGLIILSPLILIIGTLIKLASSGPIFFTQKRVGKNGQVFTVYKFRTMTKNAKGLKEKYVLLNEADGPVFKIRNDPRYTKFGKKLARTGLDELPQFLNILKGQMSLVGPRPLPVDEEKQIPAKWKKKRQTVRPGIISSWVANSAFHNDFAAWMKLDLEDIKKSSLLHDLKIILKTFRMVYRASLHQLRHWKNNHKK